MIKKITAYITHNIDPHLTRPLLSGNPHVIVGLSGGPDSVFLLHVLNSLRQSHGLHITAAHLNHGWRDSAHVDEIFCKKLCKKLDIKLVIAHAKDLDVNIKEDGSKENMGRKLRRHFFSQVKSVHNCDYIALAHHQQDQQETFFLRLIRGCSLEGLTGIKPVHLPYIRPLLGISKEDILGYLKAHNHDYVIDQSNYCDTYLRNRIRSQVLPALRSVDPRFDQKFESSLKTLIEENKLLTQFALGAFHDVFTSNEHRLMGDKKKFMALAPILQKRIIIEWLVKENVPFSPSDAFLQEIIRYLVSERGGKHELNATWQVVKRQGSFWITHTQIPKPLTNTSKI